MFGNEVNLASKLGEDVAAMGEVLLTPGAMRQLTDPLVSLHEESVSISDLTLTYGRVR